LGKLPISVCNKLGFGTLHPLRAQTKSLQRVSVKP
jgi:hypothetical protein